jgi:hypothetical protein
MSDHRKCPRDFSQSATLDFKSVPMGGGVLACFDPQWPDLKQKESSSLVPKFETVAINLSLSVLLEGASLASSSNPTNFEGAH